MSSASPPSAVITKKPLNSSWFLDVVAAGAYANVLLTAAALYVGASYYGTDGFDFCRLGSQQSYCSLPAFLMGASALQILLLIFVRFSNFSSFASFARLGFRVFSASFGSSLVLKHYAVWNSTDVTSETYCHPIVYHSALSLVLTDIVGLSLLLLCLMCTAVGVIPVSSEKTCKQQHPSSAEGDQQTKETGAK